MTRTELDELEQANILQGMTWLNKQKTIYVLAESFVITLHKKLFGEVWHWAGKFRQTGKNIGVPPEQVVSYLYQLLADARFFD